MILYNKIGEKIDFDITKATLIKNGDCGMTSNVYHYGHDCIKIFNGNFVDEKIIKSIKNIKSDNLYKIIDLYYNGNGDFSAYIAKYYEEGNINILTMLMDYILDNFSDLIKLSDLLSKNRIEILDLHPKNIILQESRMIVIDADHYHLLNNLKYNDNMYQRLKHNNIFMIKLLMCSLLYYYFKSVILDESQLINMKKELKNIFLDNMCDLDSIYDSFKCYKYPMEYVKKYIN